MRRVRGGVESQSEEDFGVVCRVRGVEESESELHHKGTDEGGVDEAVRGDAEVAAEVERARDATSALSFCAGSRVAASTVGRMRILLLSLKNLLLHRTALKWSFFTFATNFVYPPLVLNDS